MNQRKIPSHSCSCRSIVWIDSSVLKAQEHSKCKKLYQKLQTARRWIDLHESQSVPEYQTWIHSHFWRQLTEIRELSHKCCELQHIVQAVQTQSFLTGCTPWKAYTSLMRLKAKGEEIKKMDFHAQTHAKNEEAFQASENEFQQAGKEEFFRLAFEAFFGTKKQWRSQYQSYEQAFQEFKKDFLDYEKDAPHSRYEHTHQERTSSHASPFPKQPSQRQKHESCRLKELYRNLARKLHPDRNPDLSPKKMELWHQVQQAYEARDLSRLQTLSTLSELEDPSWEKMDGISTLRNLFHELKTALRQVEKKIKLAKKDKAWMFYEKRIDQKQLLLLEREIAKQLSLQANEIRYAIQGLQSLIENWKHPSKKKHRRKNSRSSRGDSELQMFSEFF